VASRNPDDPTGAGTGAGDAEAALVISKFGWVLSHKTGVAGAAEGIVLAVSGPS